MANQVTWGGHTFTIHTMEGTTWNDVGGVYVFAGPTSGNVWKAYYIGITESFQNRHPNHERWEEAKRLGATHVHARAEAQAASREAIEKALIGTFQPPLNTHHR
jgi:hypothetical protein